MSKKTEFMSAAKFGAVKTIGNSMGGFFGDDADENIHHPFFARTSNCKVLQFANADHNIAAHLKSKNLLTDWLEQGQVSDLVAAEDLVS